MYKNTSKSLMILGNSLVQTMPLLYSAHDGKWMTQTTTLIIPQKQREYYLHVSKTYFRYYESVQGVVPKIPRLLSPQPPWDHRTFVGSNVSVALWFPPSWFPGNFAKWPSLGLSHTVTFITEETCKQQCIEMLFLRIEYRFTKLSFSPTESLYILDRSK